MPKIWQNLKNINESLTHWLFNMDPTDASASKKCDDRMHKSVVDTSEVWIILGGLKQINRVRWKDAQSLGKGSHSVWALRFW